MACIVCFYHSTILSFWLCKVFKPSRHCILHTFVNNFFTLNRTTLTEWQGKARISQLLQPALQSNFSHKFLIANYITDMMYSGHGALWCWLKMFPLCFTIIITIIWELTLFVHLQVNFYDNPCICPSNCSASVSYVFIINCLWRPPFPFFSVFDNTHGSELWKWNFWRCFAVVCLGATDRDFYFILWHFI